MAMILGISSFATFTTQAMEETGTQEVQSQSQDGADGEVQAQSSGDSVDRISFGTAFGDGNDAAILSPGNRLDMIKTIRITPLEPQSEIRLQSSGNRSCLRMREVRWRPLRWWT